MSAPYMERDTCQLPPLIDGPLVLPAGSRFACPHYVWFVQWNQFNGWRQQPMWRASTMSPPTAADIAAGLQAPTPSVPSVTTIATAVVKTTAVLLLGGSQDVTVPWTRQLPDGYTIEPPTPLLNVTPTVLSSTASTVTVRIKAGLAIALDQPVAALLAWA